MEAMRVSPNQTSQPTSFKLGSCSTPCGRRGPWAIEEFEVSETDARIFNMRASMRPGARVFSVQPGRYKRLIHDSRGVVMSNTHMEVFTNRQAFAASKGFVLINGLGMGMLLEAILAKPEVNRVRVVELDDDVLKLVGPHFSSDPRVELVHHDALTYKPPRGEQYDFVWHDIWDTITSDNLPQMKALTRKYRRPRSQAQACWSRELIDLVGH